MTAWILVGDGAGARLFTTELPEQAWSLVQSFEHPEGRRPSREIEPTSPPGKSMQSKAPGAHHTALEPRTWPKEAEAERFAQLLADHLESATARREYDSLVLVAPPHFLGLLKARLGRQTSRHLQAAIDKDLTALEARELREKLLDDVFPQRTTKT